MIKSSTLALKFDNHVIAPKNPSKSIHMSSILYKKIYYNMSGTKIKIPSQSFVF